MKAVRTRGSLRLVGLIAITAIFAGGARVLAKPQTAPSQQAVSTERAFLNQYCVGCHNQTAKQPD